MTKTRLTRVHESLLDEYEKIARKRIEDRKDKSLSKRLSFPEFSEALPRHSLWETIKNDMLTLDKKILKNKKGGILNVVNTVGVVMLVLAVAIIFVVVFAIMNHGFGIMTSSLSDLNSQDPNANVSYYAGQVVFGNFNVGLQQLEWISWMFIFGMFLGALIGMFIIREHPVYLAVYIIFGFASLFISIFISRAYEKLYTDPGVIGTALQSWTASSWMILYSPIITTVLLFVGAILMFVVWNTDPSQGSLS